MKKSTYKTIALKNLFISPENARTVSASSAEDKELLASIRSQGLLQPLIVIPSQDHAGMFEVVGGGRRLSALQLLVIEGEIDSEFTVECTVKARSDATLLSLSENLKATMHPADEFMAYKKLSNEGKSEREIAVHFGRPALHIKKLLKLSSVAPELIEVFRAGKLSFECIMAFTVSDDRERQLNCWRNLNRASVSPWAIKQNLLVNSVTVDEAIVKFVSLKAYKAAGGAMSADLFTKETYCLDLNLLETLAGESLQATSKTLLIEGWKWVETCTSGSVTTAGYLKITADFAKVPKKLLGAIEETSRKINELNGKDFDDWTESDDIAMDELSEKLETLETEKESYRAFTIEQKSQAGCIITFDQNGTLRILRGLVRKEDARTSSNPSRDSHNGDEGQNKDLSMGSASLKSDLKNYAAQAFHASTIVHQELTINILYFTIATAILEENHSNWSQLLNIQVNKCEYSAIDIESTKASEVVNDAKLSLNLNWLNHDTDQQMFASFVGLTQKEKIAIVTFCLACSFRIANVFEADSLWSVVGQYMNFQLSDYWKPTTANYFGRLTKPELLNIGDQLTGGSFRGSQEKCKKMEIASSIESLPEITGWMPDYFSISK